MRPVLHDVPYMFGVIETGTTLPADVFAVIHEAEGTTLIAPAAEGEWARISLLVHSSLSAVGLRAAVSRALAEHGISANIVAGYYHDHIFVPWGQRHAATTLLTGLSEQHS